MSVLQMEKFSDFVCYQRCKALKKDYHNSLCCNHQRNAERVTAEEIRYLAGELEDTYQVSLNIIKNFAALRNRKIDVLTKAKKLPKLPDNIVKPTIVTGMEALVESLHKLDMFIQEGTALGRSSSEYVNHRIT